MTEHKVDYSAIQKELSDAITSESHEQLVQVFGSILLGIVMDVRRIADSLEQVSASQAALEYIERTKSQW